MNHPIKVEMHQREEINGAYVRICRRGRSKSHFGVTPASRRRLGRLINNHSEKFTIRPYVTEVIGWTAESN